MKRPSDVPVIADALAWLSWFATMLGAMASAADLFSNNNNNARERERASNAVPFDARRKEAAQ